MSFSELKQLSKSNVICVQSETAYEAIYLINEYISKRIDDDKEVQVHWFTNDVSAQDAYDEIRLNKTDRNSNWLHFHPYFPLKTNDVDSAKNMIDEIGSLYQSNRISPKKLVVVDSLSTLVNENDLCAVNRVLRFIDANLQNESVIQTLLVWRRNTSLENVNTKNFVKYLDYLVDAWLTISNNTVTIKIKRSNGKLIKEIYECCRVDGKSSSISLVKKRTLVERHTSQANVDAPTSCSTFKLDLTDQEKEARNAVQLPYVRCAEDNDKIESNDAKIFYNPDEYDDWDEEEPDNDLEFV